MFEFIDVAGIVDYRGGACQRDEMPDTSLIIRDVVRMSDGAVAMRDNMTKEELV